MNLPQGTVFPSEFAIWFENDIKDRSNVIYKFRENALIMGIEGECTRSPVVKGAIAYQLCGGGGLFDVQTRMILQSTGDTGSFPLEQIIELNVAGRTKVEIDFDSDEGFKMSTGINLSTFNMTNIDQLDFQNSQGFNNAQDHGDRRITGGSEGINLNIPKVPTNIFGGEFDIWFEDDALTRSDVFYRFTRGALILGNDVGDCVGAPIIRGAIGFQLCRGGGLFELGSRMLLQASGDSGTLPSKQILEINVAGAKKMEFRDTGADHIRCFQNIGMELRSIRNIDQLIFASIPVGAGTPSSGQFGITVDPTDFEFLFHASTQNGFRFESGNLELATLSRFQFRLLRTSGTFAPSIVTEGSFVVGEEHVQGDFGIVNGEHRLVNDGTGSLDVFFGTGDKVVNLSQLNAVGPEVSTSDLAFFQDEFVYVDDTVINSKYETKGTFNSVGGELYGVIEMDSGDTSPTSAGRLTTENSFRIDPSLDGNSTMIITPIPESSEQFHFYGYSSNDLEGVTRSIEITANNMYGFMFDPNISLVFWSAITIRNGVRTIVTFGATGGQNNTRQRLEASHINDASLDDGEITFKIDGVTQLVQTTNIPDGEMFLVAYASNKTTVVPTQRSMFIDFWQATAERIKRP